MAIELTEMIIIGQMMVLLGVIVVQGLLKQLQHAQNINIDIREQNLIVLISIIQNALYIELVRIRTSLS